MRPILFLDVDGVLNCFNRGAKYDIVQPDPDGMIALVPPGMTERVRRLREHYDIVWATAWLGAAHAQFRDHLELPDESFPYVSYRDYKLTEIIRYAAGRRWAWVDDDAMWELDMLGWRPIMIDGLIIAPDTRFGLKDHHVEELVAYASSV